MFIGCISTTDPLIPLAQKFMYTLWQRCGLKQTNKGGKPGLTALDRVGVLLLALGSNHTRGPMPVRLHHTSPSYLTFYSRGQTQVTLLSPRTSSGRKSTPISKPSAPSSPTTLAPPAGPKSHCNQAYMPVRSSTFSRMASISSAGSFSLPDALSKPRQRSLRWTASAVRALSSDILILSDRWPPSAHVDPCPTRPPVLQHA